MSLLMWDKPARIRSPQAHAESYGFEEGPAGGYVPNMSEVDAERWKAKVTGQKRGVLQVEIRKRIRGTQVTIIVTTNGGYSYKWWGSEQHGDRYPTDGINIHMAANGPMQLTFDELADLQTAVSEAREKLVELEAA